MTRIAILGIGGVGGYLGGKLASRYSEGDEVEIVFIARGENGNAIRANGLKLKTAEGEEVSHPGVVSDQPEEIGLIDYLLCCVKSYHLDAALPPLEKCLKPTTVILPFLNGVDAAERIESIFPDTEVWEGCVYIMARLTSPGVVEELGGIHQYHFGSDKAEESRLSVLQSIFSGSDLESYLSDDIQQTIWDKYLLISSVATLTSYLDLTIKEIFADDRHRRVLEELIAELKAVGEAKGVNFSDGVVEKTLKILSSSPEGTTSSMHSDFQAGGRTEFSSLTEYVVRCGTNLGVPVPNYQRIASALKTRGAV